MSDNKESEQARAEGPELEAMFKHLVYFGGYLVPIAHIKAVETWIEEALVSGEEGEEEKAEFGFRIFLSAPLEDASDNLSVELFQSWPTEDEASQALRHIAERLDKYYDKLLD